MTLSPQNNWYAFEGVASGTAKDANGRYKIAVGPKILDPNYSDQGKIWASDFNLPARVDVVLINEETGATKIIECVVVDLKAHTYNRYGNTAAFDVESGILQTGIAYPNSWNATHDMAFAPNNIDSSSIEFMGAGVDFACSNYRLNKIIVIG